MNHEAKHLRKTRLMSVNQRKKKMMDGRTKKNSIVGPGIYVLPAGKKVE